MHQLVLNAQKLFSQMKEVVENHQLQASIFHQNVNSKYRLHQTFSHVYIQIIENKFWNHWYLVNKERFKIAVCFWKLYFLSRASWVTVIPSLTGNLKGECKKIASTFFSCFPAVDAVTATVGYSSIFWLGVFIVFLRI